MSNTQSNSSSYKHVPILNKFPLATSSPTKQKLNIMSEPVLAQFIQKHRTIVHHHFNSDLDAGLRVHSLLKSMIYSHKDDDDLVSLKSKMDVEDEGISIIDKSPESTEIQASISSSLKSFNSTLSVKDLNFPDKSADEIAENLESSQHSSETLTVTDLHANEEFTKEGLEVDSNRTETSDGNITSNLKLDPSSNTDALTSDKSELVTFKHYIPSSDNLSNITLQVPQSYTNEDTFNQIEQDSYLNSQVNQLINKNSQSNSNLSDIGPNKDDLDEKDPSETRNQLKNHDNEVLDRSDFDALASIIYIDREQTTPYTNIITLDQCTNNSLHLKFQFSDSNEVSTGSGGFDNTGQDETSTAESIEKKEELPLMDENELEDPNDNTITSIHPPDLEDDINLDSLTQVNPSSSTLNNSKFNTDMDTIYSRLRSKSTSPLLSTSTTFSTHDKTLNEDLDNLDLRELKFLIKDLIQNNKTFSSWYEDISNYIPSSAHTTFERLASSQKENLATLHALIHKQSLQFTQPHFKPNKSKIIDREVDITNFVENYRDHDSRVQLAKYLASTGKC